MDTTVVTTPIRVRSGSATFYEICYEPLESVPVLAARAGLKKGVCLIVSDETVASRHGVRLLEPLAAAGWTPRMIRVPAGEMSKSLRELGVVYDQALESGLDRGTPLFAFGGGVVGDLAGFAAATLLRGIPLVQLPTTLVAQVDSSIGGKTGINHPFGKNLIGAFHQPRLVVADLSTLETLPDREWASGLAEVVKHALISDRALFDFLSERWGAVLARESSIVSEMVPRATKVKARVVQQDERETGPRAHLNFGHTVGHAIERVAGYGAFTHGEAVAIGMQTALYMTQAFHPDFPLEPALDLVRRIPAARSPVGLAFDDLMQAMRLDKKAESGRIRFVLLREIGRAYVRAEIKVDQIRNAWLRTIDYFEKRP